MPIWFHAEDVSLPIQKKSPYKHWITSLIQSNNKKVGEINYIFCSDDYLLEVNKEHLNHDYYTDIITFPIEIEHSISTDIFISIDRVKDNAFQNNIDWHTELLRVMAHGILHLIGWNDKTAEEARLMRNAENDAIEKFHVKHNLQTK